MSGFTSWRRNVQLLFRISEHLIAICFMKIQIGALRTSKLRALGTANGLSYSQYLVPLQSIIFHFYYLLYPMSQTISVCGGKLITK